MIHPRRSSFLAVLLLAGVAIALTGCATEPTPSLVSSPLPHDRPSALAQLSDSYWTDLSDAREIYFKDSHSADASNPCTITVIHRGSGDNSFNFIFSDQTSAYAAWKRLVGHLGGSLKESDWKASAEPSQPASVHAAAAGDIQPAPEQSESYTNLRTDLNALTACRDQKMITQAEFDLAHDRTVNSFFTVMRTGSVYQPSTGQMHADFVQLELLKKDRLISDEQAAALHNSILVHHNMAPG